ncbi:MAG: indole-3-glycerol phosphate synthase TrpC [Desulfamplus sp.]|nr:indole-3-glycerol phosphate synthase TrpC [Desulfamplus sp.]
MGISGFLKEVVELKKLDIAEVQRIVSLNSIRKEAEEIAKGLIEQKQGLTEQRIRKPFLFLEAVKNRKGGDVGIIAEIKKASPSKGDIKLDLDPAKYADEYTKAGACAVSVLTERHYFKGSLDDLKAVRDATHLPILRKDFTLSSYQIYEAKAAGVDSILLIVAMLSKEQLRDYVALSRELGMEPLVEINSEWEVDKTLFANAKVVGINNRNLETLKVDLNVSKRVVPFLTEGQIAVEASGISSPDDIQKGLDCKIFNFLVGESIVRAKNTKEFIQSLVNRGSTDSNSTINPNLAISMDRYEKKMVNGINMSHRGLMVKICGLTNPEEALLSVEAGADAIGFIFYPKSPRYISPEQASEITRKIPNHIMTTGVFVDDDYKAITKIVKACSLKAVQLHGNESPSLVKQLSADGLIVIKALFAGREPHLTKAHLYDDAYAILVEYGKGELPGGNGESWNWELAAEALGSKTDKSIKTKANDNNDNGTTLSGKKEKKQLRVILAGGLNPDNIEKAIEMAFPWGVDVSSGVEFSPGKKDIDKVKKLIEQIRKF